MSGGSSGGGSNRVDVRRTESAEAMSRGSGGGAGKGEYPARARQRKTSAGGGAEEEYANGGRALRQRTCVSASMEASLGKCLNLSSGVCGWRVEEEEAAAIVLRWLSLGGGNEWGELGRRTR